ncbi:surface lipoprotein assembly modifier [Alkalilimnicola ehrlichii]|uniref:surface lipoprotein assembly modifier n=1 Tax=Alkalilimnicola ehrlichii TaxID=351052 RepID=UPI0026A2EFAE
MLEQRRRDEEQTYTLTLRAQRFSTLGLTPALSLRHQRVDSSVDWLYSYQRNTASLKLERRF